MSQQVVASFTNSRRCKPAARSTITLLELDRTLRRLEELSSQDEMRDHLEKLVRKCTASDLLYVVRYSSLFLAANSP
jgi:hypothetical protein